MTSEEQGKLFRVWRNSASVTEPGILDILHVNPVVLGILAAVSGAGSCTSLSRFECLMLKSADGFANLRFVILL